MLKWIILAVVILALIALVLANIRVVPQSKAFVLERLGTFYATWQTGLHVKIPFIDRIAKTVSLKEQVVDFKPQAVITKDNVTMQIDTVVFFQITDPKLYTYGVESPISAIENLSATTLRNIIGEMELDSTLTSRDTINTKIRVILDEATANIDTETELLIQDSLEKMRSVGTMLMVAHRLSTIQHADNIIVLSHGKILEQGTHQELLAKHGRYYQLYTLQYHKEQMGE